MKKSILILLLTVLNIVFAQNPQPIPNGVRTPFIVPTNGSTFGINTTSPAGALDVVSTTKGVLFPRMTTTQRNAISSPSLSTLIFNTTTNQYEFYDGDSWESFGSAIPSLQSVTDVESITTNPIRLNDDTYIYSIIDGVGLYQYYDTGSGSEYLMNSIDTNYFQCYSLDGDYGVFGPNIFAFTRSFGATVAIDSNSFVGNMEIRNQVDGKFTQIIFPESPTHNLNYLLPTRNANATLTIPVSVNGNFADSAGNITVSAGASGLNDVTLVENFTEQNIEFQGGSGLDFNTGTYILNVKENTLTGSRNLGFPDASGTLVTTVNGVTSDANGNVNVPNASSSVNGLAKLYTNLSASNTDGSVTQSAIVTGLNLKQDLPIEMTLNSDYTLTSTTSVQKLFNVGATNLGSMPLEANSTYDLVALVYFTDLSTTSSNFSFDIEGTATYSLIFINGIASKTGYLSASGMATSFITSTSATALTTNSTAATGFFKLDGEIRSSSAGTFIPSIVLGSASAAVVKAGSKIILRKKGTSSFTHSTGVN